MRCHVSIRAFGGASGRAMAVLLSLAIAAAPRALGQTLPDLGGGDGALSPQVERRIGEEYMREIRVNPAYVDDPEISDYLNTLGAQLVAATPGAGADFEFFAVRDSAINAFALPGGFVGVHTGLILATDSESELASVLAHEVSHVTQRHISRMASAAEQSQLPTAIAVMAAILLARSRPDLATGAVAMAQARDIQYQLNYTRDFEREADRIGFQTLAAAGFDTRGMPAFFEKMQRLTRLADDGTVPSYLRTHPVTSERIADAMNRAADQPFRQRVDSIEYQLVRAKLRAEIGQPNEAVEHFSAAVRERRYANEAAARYGLAIALLRAARPAEAADELARLGRLGAASPMIATLDARVRQAHGDEAGAASVLEQAMAHFAHRKPVLYAYLALLHQAGRYAEARDLISRELKLYPKDLRLHSLYAKTYAALGKRLLQHQAQAEVYVLQGSYPAAIEQLMLARSAGDGDFYQVSIVEARLKELRERHAQQAPRPSAH
jgi:predicted Zn-dependent protease